MKGTLVSKKFVKIVKENTHGETCKTGQFGTLKTIFSIIKTNEGEQHNCNLPLIKWECYFKSRYVRNILRLFLNSSMLLKCLAVYRWT